jgi:predicted aspartyl protease
MNRAINYVIAHFLRVHVIIFFIILTCSFLFTTDISAQEFQFTGNRKREALGFKMVKNLIIIQININGKGPFNFVLDTGVGLFIISDPKLIDSVSIKNLRNITIVGFGEGEALSAYVAPSVEVQFGSAIAKNMPAAILKKDIFELSNYAGMPIHGLIGYEFFNSFIVRMNFPLNTLTIYSPESLYIPNKGQRIPLNIEDKKPYVTADIVLESGEKIPAKFIIDTGAGHPVSLEKNEGLAFKKPAVSIPGNLGMGLTGPIRGSIGRISSLTLGKYTLNNVIAAFPNYEDVGAKIRSMNRNGNMGISILKRFNVIFDYKHSSLFIKPSYLLKEPFEHDMSGMELTSAGLNYNRLIVTRVEEGSSAAECGIKRDDEILAINFKSVSEMTLSEIDNLFSSRSGRSFIIDVLQYGSKKRERVILTLKRRI